MVPDGLVFGATVSVDCFIQLRASDTGAFFITESDPNPAHSGFEALYKMAESLTRDILTGPDARLVFRVFILQHRNTYVDRSDRSPIYSSTTRLAGDGSKTALIMKRDYDEDFAKCVVSGGCQRCRGGNEG